MVSSWPGTGRARKQKRRARAAGMIAAQDARTQELDKSLKLECSHNAIIVVGDVDERCCDRSGW